MNCKACRIEIEELEGAEPLCQMASAHVESCSTCRAFLDERLALKQMIGGLEVVAAPADFDFRLRARLASVKSEGHGNFGWSSFAPGGWSLAIAASLVMMIAVGLIVRQGRQTPNTSTVAQTNTGEVTKNEQSSIVSPAAAIPGNGESAKATTTIVPVDGLDSAAPIVKRTPRAARSIVGQPKTISSNPNPDGIRSADFGGSAARQRTPPGIPDLVTDRNTFVAVPVRAALKPSTITLYNVGTKPQTISVRPVTFGGQDVFEQGSANSRTPTVQGIW